MKTLWTFLERTLILVILAFIILTVVFPIKQSSAYNYNGREYKIEVPSNIIELEHCYFTRACELSKRNKALIKLNVMLIKLNLNPLYK